jgi:acyl carrier protein
VEAQIAQVLGLQLAELDWQTGFFDLGLDSLTALELKNSLQASLGCVLPSTLTFDYPTVAELLDYLATQIGSDAKLSYVDAVDVQPIASVEAQDGASTALSEAEIGDLLDRKLAELERFTD